MFLCYWVKFHQHIFWTTTALQERTPPATVGERRKEIFTLGYRNMCKCSQKVCQYAHNFVTRMLQFLRKLDVSCVARHHIRHCIYGCSKIVKHSIKCLPKGWCLLDKKELMLEIRSRSWFGRYNKSGCWQLLRSELSMVGFGRRNITRN